VTRPGLANQQHLLQWADSVAARSEFPRLIRRLILETGRGVTTLGFPAGEGVSGSGWDGTARSTEATAFISLGLSLWELSVEASVGRKADSDYAKRLATPDGSPTTEATYIAATLRRFGKRVEWARDHAGDGRWREVRGYGVDDIEAWLETAPVTHYWLSELLGLSPAGLVPAETWWRTWLAATTPTLTPEVVTAGRNAAVDALRGYLAGPPQVVTIKGGSVDEVLAFVWATVQGFPPDQAGPLAARAAWVDDVATWRVLREHSRPLLLAPLANELTTEMGAGGRHHIVVPILGAAPADITLPPLDSQLVSEALKSGGLHDRRAEESGRIARMSLLAMRRHLAVKPELHQPPWARPPVLRAARAGLLLGRWDSSLAGDRAAAEALFGVSYDVVSEDISTRLTDSDPLISITGAVAGLVSPFDAWLVFSRTLTMDDLERFRTLALVVFKEMDPRRNLPPNEQWRAATLAQDRIHSPDLRQGLATTLALLGGHGDFPVQGSSTKAIGSKLGSLSENQGQFGQMRFGRSPMLEDTQALGLLGEIDDGIGRLAPLVGGGEEVQAAIDHLQGEGGEGTAQRLGDRVGQIDQHGVEEPGGPDLELDPVGRADPEVGQAQKALDCQKSVLDPPALPIQGDGVGGREASGIEFVGEVAVPGGPDRHLDQADRLARRALPDPDEPIAGLGRLVENPLDLVTQIALGAGHEGDPVHRQLEEKREVGVAQVDDQQGPVRDGRADLGPVTLVVGQRVGLVPNLAGQPRAQVEHGSDSPRQRRVRTVLEQADLAEQGVEGRAVGGKHRAEVIPRPGEFGGQRTLAQPLAFEQGRQEGKEHFAKERRGEDPQPQGESLLGDLDRSGPEEALLAQQVEEGAHRADLPPDHAQDQRDHHRQGEQTLAQPQIVIVRDLGEGMRVDQLGEPLPDDRVRRSDDRTLAPIPLDRPGVAYRTLFLGRSRGSW
jgi:hypothetical protein